MERNVSADQKGNLFIHGLLLLNLPFCFIQISKEELKSAEIQFL